MKREPSLGLTIRLSSDKLTGDENQMKTQLAVPSLPSQLAYLKSTPQNRNSQKNHNKFTSVANHGASLSAQPPRCPSGAPSWAPPAYLQHNLTCMSTRWLLRSEMKSYTMRTGSIRIAASYALTRIQQLSSRKCQSEHEPVWQISRYLSTVTTSRLTC